MLCLLDPYFVDMTNAKVRVNGALIKQQMKCARVTPQMITALCGYSTTHGVTFNYWMREGHVPRRVAHFLKDTLKFKLS